MRAIALKIFFNVPYVYTIWGLPAWIFGGHLITLDDDMPGEWSNPLGLKKIIHSSLFEMMIKFFVFSFIELFKNSICYDVTSKK